MKQTKTIWLVLLLVVILFTFSYFVYNDLYFRLAPSSNMPNGTWMFSLWLPLFPLPSMHIFFLTVCPLSQIHHNFWRGKHLAPLGCYTLFPLQTKIIPKSSSQNTNQPLVSLWIMYFELQMFGSTYINRIYPFSSKVIILKEIKK